MAVFPDYDRIRPSKGFKVVICFQTLINGYDNGAEQRRAKRLYPRRDVTLKYNRRDIDAIRTIWQFYIGCRGCDRDFSFYLHYLDNYFDEYAATADGLASQFNLSGRGITSHALYLDGVPLTEGRDYDLDPGMGTDGSDSVIFTTPPPAGGRLTCDFNGYLRIRCRFAKDELSYEMIYNYLTTIGLKLHGLPHA